MTEVDQPCIDLSKFGQYRIGYEESYYAQYGPHARINDPWLKIIPCRSGHICPWGSNLAAVTAKPGPTARKLAALPGAMLWQDGSDGVTVLFDAVDFDQVAKLMHPRRKRQVSPAERERLRTLGRQHGFGASRSERPCVETALCAPEAVPVGSAPV